jgi:hypothetical protein
LYGEGDGQMVGPVIKALEDGMWLFLSSSRVFLYPSLFIDAL